jgi:hypothetical protein
VIVDPSNASANVFGQCAHEVDSQRRIAACIVASKSTSYPWILHWVYRELASAHRERGEIKQAIASYVLSLAAEEREWVRQEMHELTGIDVTAQPAPAGKSDAPVLVLRRH